MNNEDRQYALAFGYAYGRQDEKNKQAGKSTIMHAIQFAEKWSRAWMEIMSMNSGRISLPTMFDAYTAYLNGVKF